MRYKNRTGTYAFFFIPNYSNPDVDGIDFGCLDRVIYGKHFDIKYGFDISTDTLSLNSMTSLELGENNIPMVVNRKLVNETVILEQYGIIQKEQIPNLQKLGFYIGCYKITTTKMVLIHQREIKGMDHELDTRDGSGFFLFVWALSIFAPKLYS